MRLGRIAFLFLATTWVALLAAAPSAALGAPLSGFTYALGALLCHQRPERSFYVSLTQVPVCARCCGIYLGAVAGAFVGVVASAPLHGSRLGTRAGIRTALLVSAIPTAVTWLLEAAGIWAASNAIRFIAALPLGAVVAVTVNYGECARPQRNESRLPPTPM